MTIGETLKRIRTQRNFTAKDFAEELEIDPSTYVKYERGKLIPAEKTLKKIADALEIDVHTLSDAELNPTIAMIRLFQIYREYEGKFVSGEELSKMAEDGTLDKEAVYIDFKSLSSLLYSWYGIAIREYQQAVERAETIKDLRLRADYLDAAKANLDLYMDLYPHSEPQNDMLEFLTASGKVRDFMNINPFDDDEHPLLPEERKKLEKELKSLIEQIPKRFL